MSVVVVGLEHKRVSLDLLERVAVSGVDADEVLAGLAKRENISELVVLSTCLRTEVYAVVDRFHDAVYEFQEFLAKRAQLALEDLEALCTVRFDDDVATHLFSVAAGLESAVLGESEVLGQVRRAAERSREAHVGGPVLEALFREAVRAGRRARAETAIARGTMSFAHAAVELAAASREGGLVGTDVTVLGAGEIGSGVLQALASLPQSGRPRLVTLVNRTLSRSRALVETVGSTEGFAVAPLDALVDTIMLSDVVFCSLDVSTAMIGTEHLSSLADRVGRPLLIIDLGVPRNVDPRATSVDGVTVLAMDELREAVSRVTVERQDEVEAVLDIVTEELDRYRAAVRGRGAAPVIAALRARFESFRQTELEHHGAGLSKEELAKADEVSQAVLAKLLHHPTVQLKETAGTARGERLVEALRTLFDL